MDFLKIRTTKRYNKLYFFGAAAHLEPPSHCAVRRPSSGDPPLRQWGTQSCNSWFSGNPEVSRDRFCSLFSCPWVRTVACVYYVFIRCTWFTVCQFHLSTVVIHFCRLYSIICYYEIMALIPRADSISLLLIYFMCIILHQYHTPKLSLPLPFGNH